MFSYYLIQWLKALILPPTLFFWLIVIGFMLLKRQPGRGRNLLMTGILGTFVLSLPLVSNSLLGSLEDFPPLDAQTIKVSESRAIVLLGGGVHRSAPEYGGENLSRYTLERMQYAVKLHRETGLPILITGGRAHDGFLGEANVMARVLREQFGIEARWLDNQAVNTADNARNSARLLQKEGINKILLVTHALHMPRAHAIFSQQGFEITAAPTGFMGDISQDSIILLIKPSAEAWKRSFQAFHEYFGRVWYAVRY